MKYVAIFAVIVLIIRLDFWIELAEKGIQSITSESTDISSIDVNSNREIVSLAKDPVLKSEPRDAFLSLLENFRVFPDESVRVRALKILHSNPRIFGQKLDRALEAHIYRWRDLLILNEPEVVKFLLDLGKELKGENQLMLKEFFSLWMEIDMRNFISAYSKTNDTNCVIATLFGDNISATEKINEYFARIEALTALVQDEALPSSQKLLASNCLQVLKIQVDRLSPEASP